MSADKLNEWTASEAAAVDAFESAARKLAAAGAIVDDVSLPDHFATLNETHNAMMAFESARAYAPEYDGRRNDLSARDLARIIERYDAIVAPAAKGEAPDGLGATGDPVFSRMWTLLQVPCIALPVLRGPRGLPVGIQLIGGFDSDPALLGTAQWAETRLH